MISFISLIFFQDWARSNIDVFKLQDEFYSKKAYHSDDLILVLGSSEVANLNMTHIQNNLLSPNYQTYNLGTGADVPTERLQTVDKIIELRPKIIVYGIGIRDFVERSEIQLQLEKPKNQLPNVDLLYDLFASEFPRIHLDSPKFLSLKVIDNFLFTMLGVTDTDDIIKDRTPFYLHGKDVYEIRNSSYIESDFYKRPSLRYVEPPNSNMELSALQKIVTELRDNNIKVVFFTTPKAQVYFDNLNNEQKQTFELILDELAKNEIMIYRLDDRYADLDIWYDYRHVAINQHGLIYSEDVLEIINNEITKLN